MPIFMQKTNKSKKTYFISLIALVFVLGLSGCGKPQEDDVAVDDGVGSGDVVQEDVIVGGDESEDEGDGIQEKYGNIVEEGTLRSSRYSTDDIQKFLDSQGGILKNYKAFHKTYEQSAADMILEATLGLDYIINPRVLIVLLELKADAITNSNLSEEDLNYIMDVTDEEYTEYFKKLSWEKDDIGAVRADSFKKQLEVLATELSDKEYCFKYKSCDYNLAFQYSSEVNLDNFNSDSFALYAILARLAPEREIWEQWVSKENGSFYDLYQTWFIMN